MALEHGDDDHSGVIGNRTVDILMLTHSSLSLSLGILFLLMQYDGQRESSMAGTGSIRNVRQMMHERAGSVGQFQELGSGGGGMGQRVGGDQRFKSPHEILSASGSIEALRLRNVKYMVSDFFGL